jgi:hypothetical protein
MATESRAYSRDETWRIVLTAWRFNSPFYNSIGATIKAQHWEEFTTWLFVKKTDWVEKPVDSISVSATFEGLLPGSVPSAGSRSDVRYNSSDADVRLWAVGASIGLPLPAEPSGGFGPERSPPATPGPNPASLDVRRVRAVGGATIGTENLECAEVVNE